MRIQKSDYFQDILDSIESAARIVGDDSFDAFMASETKRLAIQKLIEIIGEASSKIPAELRERYNQIEWIKIINTRHRFVHDYRSINYDIVWKILKVEFPPLASQIKNILTDMGSNP